MLTKLWDHMQKVVPARPPIPAIGEVWQHREQRLTSARIADVQGGWVDYHYVGLEQILGMASLPLKDFLAVYGPPVL